MLGIEPYISGNVGSGSVEEMAKWVEYMTSDAKTPMADLRRANGREEPWKVKYFGIGNEAWGCGGNMTPEYYSDLFRRYGTYLRNYSGNRLFKIASGASDYDYNWTRVLMQNLVSKGMNGISLHYYTVTGWNGSKGSATKFTDKDYYWFLSKTIEIEDVLKKHIGCWRAIRCVWYPVPNRRSACRCFTGKMPCSSTLNRPKGCWSMVNMKTSCSA